MSTVDAPADPLVEHWRDLVTAALLGTDRRPAPAPPAGALADLVDDTARASQAARVLADVAATAVALRAARRPDPAGAPLRPPPPDPRPEIVPAAGSAWRRIVAHWPVLEDEWMVAVIDHGWRLGPDVLVAALARHRGDAVRLARVRVAGGPLVAWVTSHVPELAGRDTAHVDPDTVLAPPELAVPPELAELLRADGDVLASVLRSTFDAGRFASSHRAVLVNLLARCRVDALAAAADALASVEPGAPSAPMAHSLADLARLRAEALDTVRAPS